jgi:hypothetical protein
LPTAVRAWEEINAKQKRIFDINYVNCDVGCRAESNPVLCAGSARAQISSANYRFVVTSGSFVIQRFW